LLRSLKAAAVVATAFTPVVVPILTSAAAVISTEVVAVFYKFCGLLVSRKENICISLVLVAHF
jgi:hypothetical protein